MFVDYSLIGAKIKAKRKENHMTQEMLAELLSVSVGYVSQVERGITKINLEFLAHISKILNCDMAYFVSGSAVSGPGYLNRELLEKYNQLSAQQRRIILGILDVLLREEKNIR